MMKKVILLIMFAMLLLMLPGCWDYTEYEDMNIISVIGVDYNDDTKEVTVTIQSERMGKGGEVKDEANKSQNSFNGEKEPVISATDITMMDAYTKIQQVTVKKMFFGYVQVVIIGEDAAKHIMGDIIGLFDRTPAIRTTAYMVIVTGKAEDAISTYDPDIDQPTGKHIYDLISTSGNVGNSYAIQLYDFARMLALPGIEPLAPQVMLIPENKTEEKNTGGKSGAEMEGIKFSDQKEGHHRIDGVAVFNGEKLAGWMNCTETLGWSWLTGKDIRIYKTTKALGAGDTKHILSFDNIVSRSNIRIRIEKGEPVIYVDVNAKVDLRKSDISYNILTPDEINVMEGQLSESIRSDIDAALKKGQKELKSDIFGFGFAFYRQHPDLWHSKYEKNWPEVFQDIPVNVNIDARIVSTGTNIMKIFVK
jgi:spore germination protein KC